MTVEVLERGILMKNRLGTRAAGEWFEKQGISKELGIIALVGSERARKYDVHVGHICSRRWKDD